MPKICRVKILETMAKEAVISTGSVNSYGSRVLTEGIDLEQYRKNPILLWMHNRAWDDHILPLGRMEKLRIDGDRLIGTPVFDLNDEFAKKIADKWESGFLRMVSAGLEIVATSEAKNMLLPGQTRPTITKCKLSEVSIVDIGANDDALQLYGPTGLLKLAKGEDNEILPLLKPENSKHENTMNKEILALLGLTEGATEQEAVGALRLLKEQASKAEALQLAGITALVDNAIAEKRIAAEKREHFIGLGKAAGIESLRETLALIQPVRKPMDFVNQKNGNITGAEKAYLKLSEVPSDKVEALRKDNPAEYMRLYKAEYGMECKIED